MVKVSVIIPTYNRRELLKKALDSIYNQSFVDYEVIVADDSSPDGTNEDFTQPRPKTTLLSLPYSGHPSIARNKGVAVAEGEYIAFLDSDDTWLPSKLEKQVSFLDNNPNIGLVSSNALVISDRSIKPRPFFPPGIRFLEDTTEGLLRRNIVITSTVVVRKAILDESGGFCEDIAFRGMEDYELWLRLSLHHKFAYLDTPLAIYLDQSNSIHSQISRVKYWRGLLQTYEGVAQNHGLGAGARNALKDALFEGTYMLSTSQLRAGNRKEGVETLANLFLKEPLRVVRRVGYELVS